MKKMIIGILLCTIIGISKISYAAYEENLIVNGDFSNGMSNWNVIYGVAEAEGDGSAHIQSTRDDITGNGQFPYILQDNVTLEANRRYEFTVEYRKDDDGQSYDGEGAMIFLVGAPHTYHTIPDKYIIQGQWYKTTHYVTLSETKTISVQYRVNSREYHVRDVRIRDTSEGIAEDILIDGSSIGNFDKSKQEYTVELPYGFTEFPSLAAVLNPSYQDACYLISQQPSKQNMKAQLKIIDSENGWSDEYNIYFKEKEPYTIHEPIFVDIGNRTQVSIQIDNNALVPMEEKSFAMIVGSYNDDSTNLNMAYVYNTQISAQGSVKLMTEIESLSQNIYCFMVDSIENIRPMMLPVRK